MQHKQQPVEVAAEVFADLISEMEVLSSLDTRSAMTVTGIHPELGSIVGFNPASGSSVICLSPEAVPKLQNILIK